MVDRQTRDAVEQPDGRAGPGAVARAAKPLLEVLPLTLTTWKDWRTRHPRHHRARRSTPRSARAGASTTRRARPTAGGRASPSPRGRPQSRRPAAPERPGRRSSPCACGHLAKAYPLDRGAARAGRSTTAWAGRSLRWWWWATPRAARCAPIAAAGGRSPPAPARASWWMNPGAAGPSGEDALALAGARPGGVAPAGTNPRPPGLLVRWYSFFPDSELYRGRVAR